ncbi:AAA family ATPase [Pseudomonas vlassakiae]|uniref:AAA family ATPase n=1 Tax=Pseudomonas vlassakiae TaxID=485888 RepID=UPI0021CA11FF|nr:AAA family ATPase [Pseudomonas vlassakiae]MCU0125032.1 AAA family ATPase [Pseudomonas vlassakiae]
MIRLNRGPVPDIFNSARIHKLRSEAASFFDQPKELRAQRRFEFQKYAAQLNPGMRKALAESFPSKCAYCETPIEKPLIELFRPRQNASNLDGSVEEDCYWWLALEWSNILPACSHCNALKGSRFPVDGVRAGPYDSSISLAEEQRLLLDPCEDEPSCVMLFLEDGRVTSDDFQGSVTIDVLGLNRETLVDARRRDLENLKRILSVKPKASETKNLIELIGSMITDDSQYAAMRRQFVKSWVVEEAPPGVQTDSLLKKLQHYQGAMSGSLVASLHELEIAEQRLNSATVAMESYSLLDDNISKDFYRQSRFIEHFSLTNIRSCENVTLKTSLGSGGAGTWLVLLGENGTGKSTTLQALACTLAGQSAIDALGIKASDLLRNGCDTGTVSVQLSSFSKPIVMTLNSADDSITVEPPEPKVMVLGYGATRLLTRGENSALPNSFVHIANIFNPLERLNNGRPWLYETDGQEFDRVARSLLALLPRSDGATFRRENRQIFVESAGSQGSDTLEALSSGYQAVLALALDILSVLRKGWHDASSAEGIVLIDEIDAHLHPRWKMRIIQRLREVFPRLQFIATSHEPLTLLGLERDEVAVLKRSLDGSVKIITAETDDLPSPRHMKVGQLLTSEYFGLHSAEDLETDMLFEEYYELLAMQDRDPAETLRLDELREELESSRQWGVTERERLVLEAADAYIAERMASRQALPESVKANAQKRLQQIWASLDDSAANELPGKPAIDKDSPI